MTDTKSVPVQAPLSTKRSFAAMRHPGFRAQFTTFVLAMMADNIEHVISYWMVYQKFHSPALAGFAIVSHWLPFLLFSVASGALADRFDPRRLIHHRHGGPSNGKTLTSNPFAHIPCITLPDVTLPRSVVMILHE